MLITFFCLPSKTLFQYLIINACIYVWGQEASSVLQLWKQRRYDKKQSGFNNMKVDYDFKNLVCPSSLGKLSEIIAPYITSEKYLKKSIAKI